MTERIVGARPHLIPDLLAALMLIAALGEWPYGYYTLLRFIVCGAGGYTAFLMAGWGRIGLAWFFGFIAVLFNPLVPVHLSRELWQPIDAVCGVFFCAVGLLIKKSRGG